MKLILIGIQGAGKSTQGNILSKELGIPYLSTGHIFRTMAAEKTQIGRYIKEVMNAGFLIPDEKTLEIVSEYLSRREYEKGYIMDGFPRTVGQAKEFKNGIDAVVYLHVSDREALWRLSFRNSGDRQDETLLAIRKRIELFHKFTEPVLDYYRKKGQLFEVDGEKSIEEISKEILAYLRKLKKSEQGFSCIHTTVMNQKMKAIAIDGPVAAGKGTIAVLLGKKLHGFPLNSGAMYRMLALYCLENAIPVTKPQLVLQALQKITLDLGETTAFLNGEDVTEKIKKRDVTQLVAKVAAIAPVRSEMVKRQQEIGLKKTEEGFVVIVEGRDAATKIFPGALLKVFLTARPEVRAKRRYEQMGGKENHTIDFEKILLDTNERDRRDYERSADPLVKDPKNYGYFVLDNSDMNEQETVQAVLDQWEKLQ